MSTNRNRAKLNKVSSNKEYRKLFLREEYPPYWDECVTLYPQLKTRGAKLTNKRIMSYQVRMYKTWKYNRKTQWKN